MHPNGGRRPASASSASACSGHLRLGHGTTSTRSSAGRFRCTQSRSARQAKKLLRRRRFRRCRSTHMRLGWRQSSRAAWPLAANQRQFRRARAQERIAIDSPLIRAAGLDFRPKHASSISLVQTLCTPVLNLEHLFVSGNAEQATSRKSGQLAPSVSRRLRPLRGTSVRRTRPIAGCVGEERWVDTIYSSSSSSFLDEQR